MESEEFMLLPVNQLIDIISSEELNVQSEELVFNAVMAWVRHNVTERRQHLSAASDLHLLCYWCEPTHCRMLEDASDCMTHCATLSHFQIILLNLR